MRWGARGTFPKPAHWCYDYVPGGGEVRHIATRFAPYAWHNLLINLCSRILYLGHDRHGHEQSQEEHLRIARTSRYGKWIGPSADSSQRSLHREKVQSSSVRYSHEYYRAIILAHSLISGCRENILYLFWGGENCCALQYFQSLVTCFFLVFVVFFWTDLAVGKIFRNLFS